MKLRILSGKAREGDVGQPMRHPITVLVTEDDGTPRKGQQVVITAKDPDALEFTGGRGFADDRTDSDGKTEFECTPLKEGQSKYDVEAGTESESGTIKAVDTGVSTAGGVTAVAGGGQTVIMPQCQHAPAPAPRPGRVIIIRR